MNIIDQEKIGKLIASIRTKKGLKQDELGKRIGTSGKNISKWETGSTFPDVVYQLPLCNELGISLEELHTGQYNKKLRRKEIIVKLLNKIFICLLLITIPLLLFFFVYYITHCNTNKLYKLTSIDKDFVVMGLVIDDFKKQTIYIDGISLTNKDIKEEDIVALDLYNKDNLIYHTNSIDGFVLQYDKKEKADINNMHLLLTIKKKGTVEYKIDLIPDKLKHNNKELTIINTKLDVKNINRALINNGFIKNGKNDYTKTINRADERIVVNYNSKSRIMAYHSKGKEMLIYCNYYIDFDLVDVSIYRYSGNIHSLVEKYYYEYSTKKITCQVGGCYSLDDTLNTLKPYVNLLSSD